MKKVMILTASVGGGHNQAAKSLEHVYKAHGYKVVIIDFLKVAGKVIEKAIIRGNDLLCIKLPYIYKGLYIYCNNEGVNSKISNYGMKIFQKRIYNRIIKEDPDLIIGTHAFVVPIICNLKRKRYLKIPFISIITDFKAHSFHINRYVDAYITASEYTKKDMMNRGVRSEKIYPYGIPIKQEFLIQRENKRYSNDVFTILLMGGSIGCSSIEQILKQLIDCKNRLRIITVCGKNKDLMDNIKRNFLHKAGNKEILLYGFTNDIPRLMHRSDILISKPGGLTVAEAIASNIPMIIPNMLPGQEEENAEFLAEAGAAIISYNTQPINEEINYLIENPNLIKLMEKNMKKLFKGYSLEGIINISTNLIINYEKEEYLLKNVK